MCMIALLELEFLTALLEYEYILTELCNLQIFPLLKLYNHLKMLAQSLIHTHALEYIH